MNITEDQAAVYKIVADILMKCLWSIVLMGCYITLLVMFAVTRDIVFGSTETVFTIAIMVAVRHYFPRNNNKQRQRQKQQDTK